MELKNAANGAPDKHARIGCISVMAAMLALLPASGVRSATSEGSRGGALQEHSDSEGAWLKGIAVSYPCAAMAMVLIGDLNGEGREGVFEFEGIPSVHSVEFLLDKTDGSRFDDWNPAMLRGPYSTGEFFVEVRWSLDRLDGTRSIVTTRAQLIDGLGEPIQPHHVIEPTIKVLVSASGYRVLSPSRDAL